MAKPGKEVIVAALNFALENEYPEIIGWSDEDIAIDLCAFCDDCAECVPEDECLYEGIKAWRAQLPAANDGAGTHG